MKIFRLVAIIIALLVIASIASTMAGLNFIPSKHTLIMSILSTAYMIVEGE